jgi:uncharacterized protein (TIGR03118 family)
MWFRKFRSHQHSESRGGVATAPRRSPKFGHRVVETLEGRALLSSGMNDLHAHTVFTQTNLVSDGAVVANITDTDLVNPWGLAASPTGPWWVSDNGANVSTVYNGNNTGAKLGLTVKIASPSDKTGGGTPTGIVFNSSSGFNVSGTGTAAAFIFATEDGTIAAWNPKVAATTAVIKVDNSSPSPGAVYKGLAEATSGGNSYIYATNFRSGKVDVFDTNFAPHTFSANQFTDRHLPARYAPFGIANLNGMIFVTYAKQDAAKHDDVAGQGLGFVDVFSTSGNLIGRVASHGPLNSPWGLAVAPSGFGRFAGDLLVGNFGDGTINAYKMEGHGEFEFAGKLKDASGRPIVIDGLWGLAVGNDGSAGPSSTLFFTAGTNGEADGLFGTLTATTLTKPKKSMK